MRHMTSMNPPPTCPLKNHESMTPLIATTVKKLLLLKKPNRFDYYTIEIEDVRILETHVIAVMW